MTRSRHRRSEGSGEPAGLPSWAQRHLDETGTALAITPAPTRTRRAAPSRAADSPLRGWGIAVVSVAAAVAAVPLAITAVANDRSDDPLPTVDTFTAGAPGPLQGGPAAAAPGRRGPGGASGDQATAGILTAPGTAPGAAAAAPVVVPAPRPAAVVRPTTPPKAVAATPRAAVPPTSTGGTGTTTPPATDDGDDDGRSATPTKAPSKSSTAPKPAQPSQDSGSKDGVVTGLVKGVDKTAGGVLKRVL